MASGVNTTDMSPSAGVHEPTWIEMSDRVTNKLQLIVKLPIFNLFETASY